MLKDTCVIVTSAFSQEKMPSTWWVGSSGQVANHCPSSPGFQLHPSFLLQSQHEILSTASSPVLSHPPFLHGTVSFIRVIFLPPSV